MKAALILALFLLAQPSAAMGKKNDQPVALEKNMNGKFYDFSMRTRDGQEKSLASYKGRPCLVVNVASECGNTPQYEGLEKLYQKYKGQGLVVLGFPANDFGKQEPGSDAEIKEFCKLNYGVTFDMFSKISVKGPDKHPLYKWLTEENDLKGEVDWNFAKFLINRSGHVSQRWKASVKPESENVAKAIEEALQQP
jgi:glutathione peroxidase